MAITKTINIDGQDVVFKASAALPRIYRCEYGRDLFADFQHLQTGMDRNSEEKSSMDIDSLEVFENIAYIMARHADPSITKDINEWLDGFNTFSIYKVLPELIQLWGMNMEAKSTPKKKRRRQKGK